MKRLAVLPLSLALACGSSPPPACDLSGELDGKACAEVKAMALPSSLPPAKGNAKGDDEAAASLGFSIFFDARFSKGEAVRCATCHAPENRFADAKATSVGLSPVTRHAPTLLNASRMQWTFWDGRADSVWSQPLFALESEKEMDFTRLELAHRIDQTARGSYEAIFGPMPDLSDPARFPARAKPGDAAWDAMAPADQEAVNRIAANVGKALEAYVRKLAGGPSRFDRFLAGDRGALAANEVHGLAVFMKAGCASCHSGPMLTDQAFHALRVPAAPGAAADPGRADAYAVLASSPFTSQGAYWDGDRPAPPMQEPSDFGAFRTPSLRNTSHAGPWGHDGTLATLGDAIDFHLAGGGDASTVALGVVDPLLVAQNLSSDDRAALVAFLESLDGDAPALPWGDWPMR